jgi:hypothetical protein
MQSDTAKARTVYQDFLTLWKDANIPILQQAKTEYVKVHLPAARILENNAVSIINRPSHGRTWP